MPSCAFCEESRLQFDGFPTVSNPALQYDSRWFPVARRKIYELKNLKPGWDGYGSPAITEAAVDWALCVLRAADRISGIPEPTVVPVPGGGIQLEWARGGKELEIEVLPDSTIAVLATDDDSCYEREETAAPADDRYDVVRRHLRWLVQ